VAATSRTTAGVLCLISRDVSHWITPILYHTVIFDDHAVMSYNSFYENYSTRRSSAHIRNLLVTSADRTLNLKDCCGLQNINVNFNQLQQAHHYPPYSSTLTHLTLHHYIPPSSSGTPRHSFCRSFTHLYVSYDKIPYIDAPPGWATNFPNLTHFVCTMVHGNTPSSASENFAQYMVDFHSSELLTGAVYVVLDSETTSDGAVSVSSINAQHPERRPLVKPAQWWALKNWEHAVDGPGESIWDQAEHDLLPPGPFFPLIPIALS
jgi:hypothetical protein